MIPIDDVTEADILVSQLDLCENCQKHKREPLTMYCIVDEEPCCTVCALSTHKACQEVVPLDELAENYSQLIKDKDIKCLYNMQKNLENITKVKTAAQKDNDNSTDNMVSDMTELVATIKQQVDELLNNFLSVVQKKKSEGLITNDIQMEMLQEFGQKLKKHSKTMELFNNLDPRQCLIAGFFIKKDIVDQAQLLEENTQLSTEVHFKFKVNEIISQLQNVQNLGLITEETSPSRAFSDVNDIGNQSRSLQPGLIPIPSPQVACVSKHNLMAANIKLLKKITKEELNIGDVSLYSAIFLQDGRLLASDFLDTNKRLLMFDSNNNFQLTSEYPVEGTPYGICTSPDNDTVHVACGDLKKVVSYTLKEQWQKISSFDIETRTTGISRSGDILITGEGKRVVLQKIDGTKTCCIKIRECEHIDSLTCTSANGEKFYHRDACNIIVGRNMDGKKEFKYLHPCLNRPQDLSCDRDGNILVTGLHSRNIHQIAADGQNGRILLEKFSSIKEPLSVCCHPHRDLFVVTSRGEDTVMEIYEFC